MKKAAKKPMKKMKKEMCCKGKEHIQKISKEEQKMQTKGVDKTQRRILKHNE